MLEPPPRTDEILSSIGPYHLIKSIGKGGMGEVFLAYDTICGRKIALKCIRADLVEFPQVQKRFLHEARVTSQLMHPAVIPIYSIHQEKEFIYYSMPYVEGQTLKQLLRGAKEHQGSIPYLTRHFLQVCQAVAYAHSKGVLHRDLKPENIIVGTYGQVFILDWGLAKVLSEKEEPLPQESLPRRELRGMTRIGKVVGTLSFMAPEQVLGSPASIQTDIYSLGVMLYQILTLTLPFRRKSLKAFKKQVKKETFFPPEMVAPYRDVPPVLSEIVRKCLAPDARDRYRSVDELICSLENYLEGKSEWLFVQTLHTKEKNDWQFQENILLAEHTAITRVTEVWDWVSLMLSREAFGGNLKIESSVRLGQKGHGIGFLFSAPEGTGRHHLTNGYCLWLASEHESSKTTRLLLSGVSVLEAPEIVLKPEQNALIRIEKIDDRVSFFFNDVLQFSYTSHHPVIGAHIGIFARDADFDIEDIKIYLGSQNIMVNCLAVPDAFLACKLYERALLEYRLIGASFPGRAEGREALFRAGITILEQAKDQSDEEKRKWLFDKALEEFGKLRTTPGAPLEYLGKSYVYRELDDYEEEAKCFELALRRYKNNPLLSILEEQIVFRMHETSRQNRRAAYHFIGLVARFLKEWAERPSAVKLFASLQQNWEVPFFILHTKDQQDAELKRLSLCLGVGFWLAKPYIIAESVVDLLERPIVAIQHLADAIFLLVELGAYQTAREMMVKIGSVLSENEQKRFQHTLQLLDQLLNTEGSLESLHAWIDTLVDKTLSEEEERLLWFLMRRAIDRGDKSIAQQSFDLLFDRIYQENILSIMAEYLLYKDDTVRLRQIFSRFSLDRLSRESCPLYFLYGCFLAQTEGVQAALTFFSTLLDIAFPRSWVLGAHFLSGKIQNQAAGWFSRSFLWERRSLYQQLALFWHAAKDEEKALYWKTLLISEGA